MSFYLKYRPRKIADLDLASVREGLGRILRTGSINHAYLFVGPRGAGKTSTARILAKVVNCEVNEKTADGFQEPCLTCELCKEIENGSCVDVIEIDAASNRGIDAIRELREKIGLLPVSARRKVYIIDEVHMLTTEAFNALLKTLEEPPQHVIFVLCTTEEHKVPETIVSRCVEIRFTKASHLEMLTSLSKVAQGENLKINKAALEILADSVDGSFREGHKLLEQLSQFEGDIKEEQVESLLGTSKGSNPSLLAKSLIDGRTKEALDAIVYADSLGVNWPAFTQSLLTFLRDQLRAQYGIGEKVLDTQGTRLQVVIQAVTKALIEMKTSVLPSLPLELIAVELGIKINPVTVERVESRPVIKPKIEMEVPQPVAKAVLPEPKIVEEEPLVDKELPTDFKVDLETVLKRWEDVLVAVAPKNHSVAGLLRSAHPKAVEGRHLVLEVFYKFHKDQLEQDAKRRLVEDALSETVGPLIMRCVLGQKAAEAIQKMPEIDNVVVVNPDKELVSAVEEAFGVGVN